MIVGLVQPDTGSIHLDGADITSLPMYRRARLGIGYLPQEASVFRGLNVEQNVMAALEVIEPDRDTRDLMLDELLDEFGIGHLRRTPALALSGGERRRVEIARALATQPAYILLDEPLAGIDPIAVGEIRDLVSHLKDRGIGVLITDHNVRETLEIIDRAYIMHDGQMLMEGRPERGGGEPGRPPRLSGRAIQPVSCGGEHFVVFAAVAWTSAEASRARRPHVVSTATRSSRDADAGHDQQLRQAIKLLQYSNLEVAGFVEEELERKPLLERDETPELPDTERAAPDQVPERVSEAADAARLVATDTLPE